MFTYEQLFDAVGNPRGHFHKKENRASKLMHQWQELEEKMASFVERGNGYTETARCAYATLLMMETGIRVGNEGSAEGFVCENKHHKDFGKVVQTYGLTTLLHRHVQRSKGTLQLNFIGKKLVEQTLSTRHKILLQYAPPADELDELFLRIDYYGLKKFVKRYVGQGYSPKDLRTAKVNLLFCDLFAKKYAKPYAEATRKSDKKKLLAEAIETTATKIGHTKGVCKSSYLSSPLLRLITADATK